MSGFVRFRANEANDAAHAVFISTDGHHINVARGWKRIHEGGRDGPTEEIVRR